ncbi:MAG TPA: GNAT family N-acetyltransferase [Anaerolineae bacterium]|jgi:hypothetical protein
MFIELSQGQLSVAAPLLHNMCHHLAVESMFAGLTPARMFVDDESHPSVVFAKAGHSTYIAGAFDNMGYNLALKDFIRGEVNVSMMEKEPRWISVFYEPQEWKAILTDVVLSDYQVWDSPRQYYERESAVTQHAALAALPTGISLQHVDASLMSRNDLINLDQLRIEMCSERFSVVDFLDKSFGVCLVSGNELIGWCLSEYNCVGRCEIGIETNSAYQRRGFGVYMTQALVNLSAQSGIGTVGWHCRASNTPSSATALRAGFRHVCDYPALWVALQDKGTGTK